MYRHPFANPVNSYNRVGSLDLDVRRQNPYEDLPSFGPSMSTESFFMSDWSGHGHRFRDTLKRYEEERDNVTVTEPEDVRIPAWKRALAVMRRRANRSYRRFRKLLHRRRRHSLPASIS